LNTEADVDITDSEDRVFNLYVHKQGADFTNKVIPDIQASSLRHNPINYTR
jgi:schlafen-like transcriptional regulator